MVKKNQQYRKQQAQKLVFEIINPLKSIEVVDKWLTELRKLANG